MTSSELLSAAIQTIRSTVYQTSPILATVSGTPPVAAWMNAKDVFLENLARQQRGFPMSLKIQVVHDDITLLHVDAIVNAANSWMLGGGGVDGAIHRAAGPQLRAACEQFPLVAEEVRCPVGECRVTPGFNLPAKFVIHTVGPVWRGGNQEESALLQACYQNSLQVAVNVGARTVAFPAISCGAYGFPVELAAKLSAAVLREAAERDLPVELVQLVAFAPQIKAAWEAALQPA